MDDTQQAEAIRLYKEGKTVAAIATQLGRGNGTVWSWISREGLIRPRKKDLHHDQALADYRRGDSYATVAARYGVSITTIQDWVKNAGLQGQGGRKATTERNSTEAVTLFLQGRRYFEIAQILKVAPSSVAHWVENSGIDLTEGGAVLAAKQDAEEAVRLYGNGATVETVARHLGRSINTVSVWLREAGVEILSSIERRSPAEQRAYSLLAVQARQAKPKAPSQQRICAYCSKPFDLPPAKKTSRQKYCSVDCSAAGRRNEDKKTEFVCVTCGNPFERWTAQPGAGKYCSKACQHTGKRAIQWAHEDNVLDSSWEALFVGLAALRGLSAERFDRSGSVVWDGQGHLYGPDFSMRVKGVQLAVEIKGRVATNDPAKWEAYRATGALLVVLGKAELEALTVLDARAFGPHLLDLAKSQAS